MNKDFLSFEFAPVIQATYLLDNATFDAIKDDLDSANGKAVTLTGDATVGFGSSADKMLGVIVKAEADGCATVRTGFYAEGVNLGASPPSVGAVVKVDGAGGLIAASTQTNYGPTLIRIDDDGTGAIKF